MRDLTKILLICATVLTSVSSGPIPEKPYVPPPKIDLEIKSKGRNYDSILEFDNKGQKIIAIYHTAIEWQDIFGRGKLHWTLGSYTIDGKQYSKDGKAINP